MDLNKNNLKALRRLILFIALVCLGVIYFKDVLVGAAFLVTITKPFIIGGAIAFVINVPMCAIEKRMKTKNRKKALMLEKIKRPLSLVLSLAAILLVLTFVIITVVPQLIETVRELGKQIPIFLNGVFLEIEQLFATNPEVLQELEKLQNIRIDWNSLAGNIGVFLKNGVGNMVSSTVNVANSIVSGFVNILIAFIFSIYILFQKEKLGKQSRRVCSAYFAANTRDKILKVFGLLHHNFSNFITGQCLEAVILGVLFFVTMSIFQFPYALLVGVLIAFTALIPIVGAFIGCFVGAFLIMIDDPMKAIGFIILFLVIQQVEGNLIYPHVVGNSVGLPSIWVLVAVSIGGSLMGVLGMLIFIPIVSTLYALFRDAVNERNKKRA